MCLLCDGCMDYSTADLEICEYITEIPTEITNLTHLSCRYRLFSKIFSNTNITKIPKEFKQLTYLNCSHTGITEIPKEFTQLETLECYNTKITGIPKEFTKLTYLDCRNTKITEVPKEFTKLTYLDCRNTKIAGIPKEFTQLKFLDCINTKITGIPKEFTKLTFLDCSNCPNLVKVPEKFNRYIKEYNFLRVPTLSRLLFNKYKRSYSENIRLHLELKFNEVYYAPTGKGALELFEKYKN